MKAGIKVINPEDETHSEKFMSETEFSTYQVDPSVEAVVVGANMSFTYKKLCIATLYLQVNNAKLIATNRDRNVATPMKKRMMPAGGSMVRAIEASGGYAPITMGKPDR